MAKFGGGGFPSGLMQETTRADLDSTWFEREEEAQALVSAGYRSMAVSLRMYALEIRLKSKICKQLNLDFLPRVCKTHDLADLIIFTGLWQVLNDPANVLIKLNWDLLAVFSKDQLNNIRYMPRASQDSADSDRIFEALDDPSHGVLPWLSKHQ